MTKNEMQCVYLEIKDSLGQVFNVRFSYLDCLCDIKQNLPAYKGMNIADLSQLITNKDGEQREFYDKDENKDIFDKKQIYAAIVRVSADAALLLNAASDCGAFDSESRVSYDILDVKKCTREMADLEQFMR